MTRVEFYPMSGTNEFKAITEAELVKLMQAHFRRYVASARIMPHPVTGELCVLVEFVNGASETLRVA